MKNALRTIDTRLTELPHLLVRQAVMRVTTQQTLVAQSTERMLQTSRTQLRMAATELTTYEKSIRTADPAHNLRLGYSLSYVNGAVVRNVREVTPGTIVTTHVVDGSFTSEVKGIK
jgi:exodeoxyribonuclease VII large subunit